MTVCRVCLNTTLLPYALNVVVNGQQIGIMLKTCVPEMYLGLSKSPVLCDICTKNLVVAFNFRRTCLKTEEYIGEYLRKAKTSHTQIELEDVVDLILKENTKKATETEEVGDGTATENTNPFHFRIENVVSLQETNENDATKVDNIKKEPENEDSNDVVVVSEDDSSKKQNKEPVLQMISMLQPIVVKGHSTDLPMRNPSHLAELPALTALDKKQMKSSTSFISPDRFGLVQTPRGPTIVKFRHNAPQPNLPELATIRSNRVRFQKPTTSKQFRMDREQVAIQQNTVPFKRQSSTVSSQQPLILNSIITPSAQTQNKKNPLLSRSAKPVKKKTSENSSSVQQKMKFPLVSYSTSSSSKHHRSASSKEMSVYTSTPKVSVVTSQNSVTSVPSAQTSVAPVFSMMSPITLPSTSSSLTFQQQFIDVVDAGLKHEKLRTLLSQPLADNSDEMASIVAVTPSVFSHSSITTSLPSPDSGNSATLSDWESRLAGNHEGEIEKEPSDNLLDPLALDVHNFETLPQHKKHQEDFCDDDHINALLEGIPEMEAEDIPEYIKIKRIQRVEQSSTLQASESIPGITAFKLVPPKADSPKPRQRRRARTTSSTNFGHSLPNRKRKRSLSPKRPLPDIRNGYYICDHDYVRGNFSCRDKTDSGTMFHCYICDYEEKLDSIVVDEHMRQHNNPKDLVCHMCSRAFETPFYLNSHIMRHPIICIVCNTEVKFHIFKEHQEMHCEYYTATTGNGKEGGDHQVIKQKKFKCRHCPSYFKTGKALEKHERYHSKEKTRRRSISLSAVS